MSDLEAFQAMGELSGHVPGHSPMVSPLAILSVPRANSIILSETSTFDIYISVPSKRDI